MSIGIWWPVISSFSLQLSHEFYAIFLFIFPRPTTSLLCVPLITLPLNGARCSFDWGGPVQQLLPLLQLHPPLLPLLQREVWLWTLSWRSFSAWMLALILFRLRCIRWTPMSVVLLNGRLALVVLWSLPLLLPRHPTTMTALTTMMMVRMEMLALPTLTRCLLDTLTLYLSWQKGGVVLVMKVVIVRGKVSIRDFC